MKLPEQGVLLRVYISELDRHNSKPLYEEIVVKAKEMNLAGATVLRGIMGYGATSRIHTAKILSLSDDLPVVVEIVDSEERIEMILPLLKEWVTNGLITMENVKIVSYRYKEE